MRSLLTLSCMLFSCAPAQTLIVTSDRTTANANGTDAVTVSATRTTVDGKPVSDFVDFTVAGSGQLSATHVQADAMGVAKTTVTSSSAGSVTVTASVPGKADLTGSTSITFNTVSGPRLAWQVSPSNTQSQNLLRPIPQVVVRDDNGVVMSSSASITVAVTPGTCGGASLDSTSLMTVNAQNGTARFYGLKITTPGTGCTLTATSTGLASAVSGSFDIIQ
jgi:adhesin/invasin